MNRPTDAPETDSPPRRKAVLFCPDCGHENPVDGDWRRRRSSRSVDYVCPDCRATVTSRPAEAPSAGALVESASDLVVATVRSTRHQLATWMRMA